MARASTELEMHLPKSDERPGEFAASGQARSRRLAVGLGILASATVATLAWSALPSLRSGGEPLILHRVERGDLEVVVVERGNLEAARNEDLVCAVEARNPGSPATSIKWIVPEGHIAKTGEMLVELDSASLRDQVSAQSIRVEQARAALTTTEADLEIVKSQNESDLRAAETTGELAEIDLRKYREGDYLKEKRRIDGDVLIAEEELQRARERLDYSQRLKDKGFVSTGEVESDSLAVTRADNKLTMAREERRVLDEFTKPRTVKDLENKRQESLRALERVQNQAKAKEAQARARYLAEKATCDNEVATLRRLEGQLEKCKLYAPIDGMVIYANETSRYGRSEVAVEEGASVRERQRIIRIPDLTSMQVNVKVHEAKVGRLARGKRARVRVESLPDRRLPGTVKSVATVADSQSFFSAGVQVFTVVVSIDEPVVGLKPGMTAEVEVLAQRVEDVLTVPIQSVIERKGQSFCYVQQRGVSQIVPIRTAENNDKLVVVVAGLDEGDEVVQNVAAVLSEEELGRLARDTETDQPGAPPALAAAVGVDGPETKPAPAGKGPAGPLADRSRPRPPGPDPSGIAGALEGGGDNGPPSSGPRPSPGGPGQGRSGGLRGNMPASLEEFFTRYDKDGDGKILAADMPESSAAWFGKLDQNGDGSLDRPEVEAFLERMKAFRPGGGPPAKAGPGPERE